MSRDFQNILDRILAVAGSEVEKGRLFERLMKAYFEQDPLYRDRFSNVWLWSEWTETRPDFKGGDTGIDLVAAERDGGYCAIQCKCYAPGTRMSKAHLDSFVSASAREPFTARIVVDTGDEWGPNAAKTIAPLKPACAVLRFGDLTDRPFDWPDLVHDEPEALSIRREPFRLRPHQQAAFDDVMSGFAGHDRGKLIMACGTGKTFTALRIAEAVAGVGGRVLYLVPSISLFQQSMREWAEQRAVPHRYVGICSDTRAGRNDEDASLQELEIPVTTDPAAITEALRNAPPHALTTVFCTYHSLGLVERAQDDGAPPFDLVLCDEAHRTTGIERPGDKTSPFVLVHDAQRIHVAKRLYMTATPRLYTEGAKSKAASHDVEVFSMDDPATYGEEFHRLPFSLAVEQDLLSDYKVVGLAMSESHVDAALQGHLAAGGGEITLTDAAKIVGCWRALQNPENKRPGDRSIQPLSRAIAFTNTIRSSKRLEAHWDGIVGQAVDLLPDAEPALLENADNAALREWFDAFHEELKVSINESITTDSAIDMMAQHILTRPVFEALFEQYDFAGGNPVAQALDALRNDFGEFGLENETRDLERFYESVRLRARGLDNSAARQRVLMELYERFFTTAMKKDADRLGIVYTPVEIVDFILASADRVLRDEFGRSLSDEAVHVLDPFTGTGIFIVRLLQSALIRDGDLIRKYHEELHANEIVLLAYYIAAIHIEEAFHGRRGTDSAYEPFGGIVLTDTFTLHTDRAGFPKGWLPVNSERAERQQKQPIQVIVGNPPWSAGQRSSADDNPNVDYPQLEQRISETYAASGHPA